MRRFALLVGSVVATVGITFASAAPSTAGARSKKSAPTTSTTSTTSTTVAPAPIEEPAPADPCDPAGAVRPVFVDSVSALQSALSGARPGDVIVVAPGVYAGRFTASVSATAEDRIRLCGAGAVLDAGSTSTGYGLHLKASYWDVRGLTVRNAQKGVMLDRASHNVLSALTVHTIGDEAVHLRTHSSSNVIENSTISDTGLRDYRFGEGVYVGSANNNWCTYTACLPDASDANRVVGNRFVRTTAEAIDIKEGTTGGVIAGNVFDGTGSSALAWVDIKGNNWQILDNVGAVSTRDGFLTSVALTGWGVGSMFVGNHADVQGPGYGFNVRPGNVVSCDNTAVNALKGLSNVVCSLTT